MQKGWSSAKFCCPHPPALLLFLGQMGFYHFSALTKLCLPSVTEVRLIKEITARRPGSPRKSLILDPVGRQSPGQSPPAQADRGEVYQENQMN